MVPVSTTPRDAAPRRPRPVLLLLLLGLVLVLLGTLSPTPAGAQEGPAAPPVLELFWAEGCPYCAAERAWLPSLQEAFPDLVVHQYEVTGSADNRALLEQRATAHGTIVGGVPMTFLDGSVWTGFEPRVAEQIWLAVEDLEQGRAVPQQDAVVTVPLVGEVDLGGTSLVAATLLIGALDGVNPCSLWALSLLLALVLHTRSRRRVMVVGSLFLAVTAGMYALYVVGLYGVLTFLAYVTWIRVLLALVAGTFGVIAIKDFFWFHRGISMSIPESRKAGMLRRMRRVADADRPLLPVLGGTVLLAVGVSLVETPCTAGFPIVWTNLLASHGVGTAAAVGLFALYMLVFLLDEAIVFTVAVVTMRAAKLQEKHGRLLKLVGGVVMLTLAVVMVAAPALLEDVLGTLVVFGVAGLVATVVAVTQRHRLDPPTVPVPSYRKRHP